MKISNVLVAGAAVALMASAAHATINLTPDAGWSSFSFGGVGATFSDDFQFTITQTSTFKITDAFLDGDQFSISINGGGAIPTSVPVNDGTQVGGDYDTAFASPKYSHLAVVLGPGAYDITGAVLQSPYGGGGAGVELVTGGVPEPATWALMLLGFGGIGFAARRRAATQTA